MPREVSLNTPHVALDLFPELPPAAVVKPPRAKRVARAAAAPSAAPQPESTAQAVTASGLSDDCEAMAHKLEAQGDFRVLRRLKPQLDWPGVASGAVTRVLVLDTETTGLDQSKERIIELALLRVDIDNATGLPVGAVQVYDELEDPGKPIPPEVVALTGIRDADVRGKTLDAERVAALLEGADLVIAHNAGFDRPFVESRFAQFAQLPWACSFADIDWKAQGRGSAKLESLAQANGWFYDAHRAEMDCHALLAVLAQKLPQDAHTGLAQLLQSAARPSYALQATNAPFEAKDKLKARGYRWHAEQRVWHTRLKTDAELQAECEWLKDNVYGQRRAVVQIEKLDARVRFSSRSGVLTHQQL
ncbi:MAG: DNA polymerase III subunit epsilon [Rhodoferax sp.]|nr:DNA polymerase III subunit epsilon [Rhodoferax sp.]